MLTLGCLWGCETSSANTGEVLGKLEKVGQDFSFGFGASASLVQEKEAEGAILLSKTLQQLQVHCGISSLPPTKIAKNRNSEGKSSNWGVDRREKSR